MFEQRAASRPGIELSQLTARTTMQPSFLRLNNNAPCNFDHSARTLLIYSYIIVPVFYKRGTKSGLLLHERRMAYYMLS